jgi:hypothetical protein
MRVKTQGIVPNKKQGGDTGRTVKIQVEVYKKLEDLMRKENPTIKKRLGVKNKVSKLASMYVEKAEIYERRKPFLHKVNVINNLMYVKDDKTNITGEVELSYANDKVDVIKIYCNTCKTDYCMHTAFAEGSEDLGELGLNLKKFKAK